MDRNTNDEIPNRIIEKRTWASFHLDLVKGTAQMTGHTFRHG